MSVEGVRRDIEIGNNSISHAPVVKTQQEVRDIDIAVTMAAVGEIVSTLQGLREKAHAAAVLAQVADTDSDMARTKYEKATEGTTDANAIDMIGAAITMQQYSKGAGVHLRALDGEIGTAMSLLRGVQQHLARGEEHRLRAVASADLAAETQPTVITYANTYLQNL